MVRFLPADFKPANPIIRSIDKINHNQNPEASKGVRFGKWLNRTVTTRVICWTALPATIFGAAVYYGTSLVVKTVTTPFTVWFSKERPELGFKDWAKHALKVAACVVSFFVSPWVSLIPVVGQELCVKMNVKLGLASLVKAPEDQEEESLLDELNKGELPIDEKSKEDGSSIHDQSKKIESPRSKSEVKDVEEEIKINRSPRKKKVKADNNGEANGVVQKKRRVKKKPKHVENNNNNEVKKEENNNNLNPGDVVPSDYKKPAPLLSQIKKGVSLKKVDSPVQDAGAESVVNKPVAHEGDNILFALQQNIQKNRAAHKPESEGGYGSEDFKDAAV
jgi:hypothetical protein